MCGYQSFHYRYRSQCILFLIHRNRNKHVYIKQHWVFTVTRVFQAFVHYENGTAPLAFYADLAQLTEVMKTGFLMASLIVGDAMIVSIQTIDCL